MTLCLVYEVRLYGEHTNIHQSHSQNASGDLRGVAGGDGKLECLCGKAGASCVCDGSAHYLGAWSIMAAYCIIIITNCGTRNIGMA